MLYCVCAGWLILPPCILLSKGLEAPRRSTSAAGAFPLSPLFFDLLRAENAERVDNKNNVLNHLGLLDFCWEADIISIGLRWLRWLLGCISFLLWRAVGYVAFYYAVIR